MRLGDSHCEGLENLLSYILKGVKFPTYFIRLDDYKTKVIQPEYVVLFYEIVFELPTTTHHGVFYKKGEPKNDKNIDYYTKL